MQIIISLFPKWAYIQDQCANRKYPYRIWYPYIPIFMQMKSLVCNFTMEVIVFLKKLRTADHSNTKYLALYQFFANKAWEWRLKKGILWEFVDTFRHVKFYQRKSQKHPGNFDYFANKKSNNEHESIVVPNKSEGRNLLRSYSQK